MHETTHYAQAKLSPTVEPGEFNFGYPRLYWGFEWETNDLEQKRGFEEESKNWERDADILMFLSIPLIGILLLLSTVELQFKKRGLATVLTILLAFIISPPLVSSTESNLETWLHFDRATNATAFDSSNSGNDWKINNGSGHLHAYSSGGRFGGYVNFTSNSGSSIYIEDSDTYDVDLNSSFTFNFWVKPNDNVNVHFIQKGGYYNIGTFTGGGGAGCSATDLDFTIGATDLCTGFDIIQKEWQMVTAVYTGSFMLLYHNGSYLNSIAYSGGIAANSEDLEVGHNPAIWYNGGIDELGLWSRSLSASEVMDLYTLSPLAVNLSFPPNNGNTPEESTVTFKVGYGGPTAYNISGFNFHVMAGANGDESLNASETIYNTTGNLLLLHFNNATGENNTHAYDWSGNDNNGTIDGATYTPSSWLGDYALSFDGTDDYIQLYTTDLRFDSGTQDFTICSSVNTTQKTGKTIFDQKDGNDDGWRMIIAGGGTVLCSLNAIDFQSTTDVANGAWRRVCCVVDRDGVGQSYVDGEADGAGVAIAGEVMATTVNPRVGRDAAGGTGFIDAEIDEIRIWARALTPAEVMQDYNYGQTESTYEWAHPGEGAYKWSAAISDYYTANISNTYDFTVDWNVLNFADEDTRATILELIYVSLYDGSTLEVLETYNTTTGSLNLSLNVPYNYMLSAYSNSSYDNQRRLAFLNAEDIANISTMLLLADGRGTENTFNVVDSLFGTALSGAYVRISYGADLIDYGLTDSEGRFTSYLDSYKIYNVEIGATGYNTSEFDLYGTSLETHELEIPLLTLPDTLTPFIWFEPGATYVVNDTAAPVYLWANIENWDLLENITVAVASSPSILELYDLGGSAVSGNIVGGSLDVFFFNLNSTSIINSWCNSTTLCSGDSSSLRWRVMPTALNSYSEHVVFKSVAITDTGTSIEDTRAGVFMVTVSKLKDFLRLLSPEQRAFTGLILILICTTSVAVRLHLTYRQTGYIALACMIAATVAGFWSIRLAVAPVLVSVMVLLGGERKQ